MPLMSLSIRWIVTPMLSMLLWSCDGVSRSDKPLSRAAAVGVVREPLPVSAREVYYLLYGGGLQDLECYLRFDVDKSEMDAAVDDLIAYNNKDMGRALPYVKASLGSTAIPKPDSRTGPIPWWNPSSIREGYYRGENVSFGYEIWADEDLGRVYVYQND